MLPLNTLCLLIWSERHPAMVGRACTIIASRSKPEEIYTVRFADRTLGYGPRRCFLPLAEPDGAPAWRLLLEDRHESAESMAEAMIKLREFIYGKDKP